MHRQTQKYTSLSKYPRSNFAYCVIRLCYGIYFVFMYNTLETKGFVMTCDSLL